MQKKTVIEHVLAECVVEIQDYEHIWEVEEIDV